MRNLRNLLLLLLFCPLFRAQAQVAIQAGTTLTVQPGTRLSLDGNAEIQYRGLLQNFGVFSFRGNFNNDGALGYASSSRFIANGSVLQTILSANSLSFPNFTVNNAAGVALASPLTIIDSLVLVNGLLYSNADNPIHFATTAANPVETKSSHIIGRSIMDTRSIGSNVMQTFLGASLSAGSDAGDVTIIRNTGNDEVVTIDGKPSIAANWMVNSTTSSLSGRNIGFSWLSSLDNNRYIPAMVLYAKETNYAKLSTQSMDVSASDPRMFVHNNINALNKSFTLLDTGFRMKFIQFTGSVKPAGAQLNWITGTEFNNKGFDLERSLDGNTFTKIDFVEGKNNALSNAYDYVDTGLAGARGKLVYYRLKQIDKDGKEQYSEILALALNGVFYFNVYPNPFNDHITIDVVKQDDDPLQVRIISVSGAQLFRKQYTIARSGRIELKGLNYLPAGTYFLNIGNQHFYETIKVIKLHNN